MTEEFELTAADARANNNYAFRWAAENGHLDVLQWLREQGCDWNEGTCGGAAAGGHLDVLRWAVENGAPWVPGNCRVAAYHGQLEALQWLRANGCPWNRADCLESATSPEVIEWIEAQPE